MTDQVSGVARLTGARGGRGCPPVTVRRKVLAAEAGWWLEALPSLVADLEREWSITLGRVYQDATEAFVAEAVLDGGTPAVQKHWQRRRSQIRPSLSTR